MRIAISLVLLAALCMYAGSMFPFSRVPGSQGMTITDWFFAAGVAFLILAGARVAYVLLTRSAGGDG